LQAQWLQSKAAHQQRQPLQQGQQHLLRGQQRTTLQPLQGRQQVQL